MNYDERYDNLNDNQQTAVDNIFGPLLIIAGPGTGKTELLSMRAANILRQTDTLPSSILCLTFTESGAANMRQRLSEIIGEDAYKVAIHTFHSFGVEIIGQNREYFFRGSDYQPADDIAQYQILRDIFEDLDRSHPLSTKNHDEFVYLSDIRTIISELKKSGLSVDELTQIIDSNERLIAEVASSVTEVFADKISKSTITSFANLATKISSITSDKLPAGIPSYISGLSLSMAHAVNEAAETGKTNAITAWRNKWCTKDAQKQTVLKDSKYLDKFRATVDVYGTYRQKMDEAKLFDYDDMILNVIQALDNHPELKATLSEKLHFLMVDEFQDTNLAQLRLLFALTDYDKPNVMAVGDDDQAIFSFQGADIGNIQRFRQNYTDTNIVVLTDNYRSDSSILTASRSVITQGEDRLENTIPDLSKELTPRRTYDAARVVINSYASEDVEKSNVVSQISSLIKSGVPAETIAILARQHNELVAIMPMLTKAGILANYERRDNALDHELVKLIETLARVIVAIRRSDHDQANALLPELVAHPAWGFSAIDIWRLSLRAWQNREHWLQAMQGTETFQPFAEWLISIAMSETTTPIEQQIDQLIGTPEEVENSDQAFSSPIYNFFFGQDQLAANPSAYLDALEALRTIRDQLRNHSDTENPSLQDLVSLIDTYSQMNTRLTVVRSRADHSKGQINLMTVHKSKGLEFDHVFVIGATDNRWGEKARGRSRLVPYPANLPLQPSGNTYDERLRLFFVAMTRAKQTLTVSFSETDKSAKPTLVASFLSQQTIDRHDEETDINNAVEMIETDWRARLVSPLTNDLKSILAPTLESYKLSATHLNNFLDVSKGGPQTFLINNLLRFPQSKSANASFGTAIHATLQHAHDVVGLEGQLPPIDKLLSHFSQLLQQQRLSSQEYQHWNDHGHEVLKAYMNSKSNSFNKNQRTELSFSSQGVVIGEARLTGALDLANIDTEAKTIFVTDYKTGRPSTSWKGVSDYEKIKLHKYRQQLMFYQLLCESSRDYSVYQFTGGRLQFVEPEQGTGQIFALEESFSAEDMDRFRALIGVVWQKITTLELPDTSSYDQTYKGILQFEQDLLDIS